MLSDNQSFYIKLIYIIKYIKNVQQLLHNFLVVDEISYFLSKSVQCNLLKLLRQLPKMLTRFKNNLTNVFLGSWEIARKFTVGLKRQKVFVLVNLVFVPQKLRKKPKREFKITPFLTTRKTQETLDGILRGQITNLKYFEIFYI